MCGEGADGVTVCTCVGSEGRVSVCVCVYSDIGVCVGVVVVRGRVHAEEFSIVQQSR